MNTERPDWRASSASSNGTNCVEVFRGLTALRDSKNRAGEVLRVDMRGLVAALRRP